MDLTKSCLIRKLFLKARGVVPLHLLQLMAVRILIPNAGMKFIAHPVQVEAYRGAFIAPLPTALCSE
jgi:hypothetical protein